MKNRISKWIYPKLDKLFFQADIKKLRRSQNIKSIPAAEFRRGGKSSLIEWGHVIGLFQGLIGQNIPQKLNHVQILDIGCGTGLLAIASKPFVMNSGKYTGIDVMKDDIDYCNNHYIEDCFEFLHHDVFNPTYSKNQNQKHIPWNIKSSSQDLVTALSVWTHLDEKDAMYYFREIARVLKPEGRAIITFFELDNEYKKSVADRENKRSIFHNTNQTRWVFDTNAYNSEDWMTTKWVKEPEDAIGVTTNGINRLLDESGLKVLHKYPGTWRENNGLYFQDVMILQN